MEKLLKALRKNQVAYPFIIAQIKKTDTPQKASHPADIPCDRIEQCRKKFSNDFSIIIYVKMKNGFYVIPFRGIDSWITESNTQNHPHYENGVKRLWFSEPDFFRSTGNRSKNMEEYFFSPEKMKEWLNALFSVIEQTTPRFIWVPIYREIAKKVIEYRNRQGDLLSILKNLQKMGFKNVSLEDHVGKNETVPLREIDPFTFLALFNVSRQKNDKAHRIIEEIQKAFGLEVRGPDDFDGVSTVLFSQTWFFNDKMNGRKDGDIPLLWDFAEAAIQKRDDRLAELFPKCLEISWIRSPKLTTGLSWLDPENYFSCNEKTISYCEQKFGLVFSAKTWEEYINFMEQLREKTSDPFYKIAHDAYNIKGKTGTKSDFVPDHESSPTVKEYYSAIETLLKNGKINDNIKICLEALYETPLTSTALAQLVGYKKYNAVNQLLGRRFGKPMCDILGKDKSLYPKRAVGIFARIDKDPQQNNEFVYDLRQNFKTALEKFPLEEWKKAVPNPKEESYDQLDDLIEHKKQVILHGPPGTGKTYLANEYVKYKTGSKEKEYVFRCTFHPEYGYEHFIEGFRPEVSNGQMTFVRKDGIFKELCDKASGDDNHKYYLIIDEINRGDIPRIFGELITLIEADKRGKSKTKLAHSLQDFTVPENVYIIGTMNTADRSIALLDTALRRRFVFIEMQPDHKVLGEQKIDGIHLGTWLRQLNEKLANELKTIRNDVKHVKIGHSYLMSNDKPIQTRKQLRLIVQHEILPLLEEYCYDADKIFGTMKDFIEKSLREKQDSKNTALNDDQESSEGNVSPIEDDME